MSQNSNNKRIAKNTMFMYMRMLLIMVVSLFTSRVVLQTLGEQDFGTYNIVGGVVVMFTFISSAMAAGTQRHLSYELGKTEGNVPEIFSACVNIHVCLAFVILMLAETIGLWFVNVKMNLPVERMEVVNWIYQFSILSCMVSIIQVPFTAAILSHERMSFYAYLSICDVLMKLGILYILMTLSVDKLLLYAILLLVVQITTFSIYVVYCCIKLNDIKYVKIRDAKLYRKLLSFSGWALFGSFANVGYQQGVNIIINLFYGVALNAAVGIANQINSAVMQFVTGFQQALNPQLVQAEAAKERKRQMDLIFKSSKFSFLIMVCITYPLLVNLDYILKLWLGNYPAYTNEICLFIMLGALLETISGPLWVTIFATGRIKKYQIVISAILLLNLPFSYIGGKQGMPPQGMYLIRIAIFFIALVVRLNFLSRYIRLNNKLFLKYVIWPLFAISIVLSGVYITVQLFQMQASSFMQFVCQTIIHFVFVLICILGIGLTHGERVFVVTKVKSLIKSKWN